MQNAKIKAQNDRVKVKNLDFLPLPFEFCLGLGARDLGFLSIGPCNNSSSFCPVFSKQFVN